MLSLCEHLGRPLVLRMEGPGLPLMAEPGGEGGGELEAQLVLATLMEGNDGLTQATGGAPAPTQPEVHTDGEYGTEWCRRRAEGHVLSRILCNTVLHARLQCTELQHQPMVM